MSHYVHIERDEHQPLCITANFTSHVRYGSFATGSSQQQVGPCPLCPDSDQILHLAEMTRWANSELMHCNKVGEIQGKKSAMLRV